MHSQLRRESSFEPFTAQSTASSHYAVTKRPQQKKMTVTQAYRLAHTARGKLSMEASRGDHDLRLLVGHANLLDSLMLDLQEAEREQEAWFNATVKSSQEKPQHIQWQDTIISQRELDIPDASDDDESDSESDFDDDEDVEMTTAAPLRKIRSPPPQARPFNYHNSQDLEAIVEDDESDEDDFYDDEEDNADLALVRTQSRSSSALTSSPPPELVSDSDDSDSDEPVSPPASIFNFAEAAAAAQHQSQSQQQNQLPEKPLIDEVEDDEMDYESLFDSASAAPMISAY